MPLMLVIAVLVKLTSRGPIIYSQKRVGRLGQEFTMHKFRTMLDDCERLTGACWSIPGDTRITSLGHLLRRTHLDELPQLWNVLTGEMSLVGPRPERPEFVPLLDEAIPGYRDRLHVLPGVTGLAQVYLPPDSDLESVRRKLQYDLYYVRQGGLFLDVRLIIVTGLHAARVPARWLLALLRIPGPSWIESPAERIVVKAPAEAGNSGPQPPVSPCAPVMLDTGTSVPSLSLEVLR
jgi:lipopolysaccharide/colanic/teichoic acid biosynthesis glycosyltransferase